LQEIIPRGLWPYLGRIPSSLLREWKLPRTVVNQIISRMAQTYPLLTVGCKRNFDFQHKLAEIKEQKS
jgi:hypothetical protein